MADVTPYGSRSRPTGGYELGWWLFMRVSGVLLLFLALGHLWIMHIAHDIDEVTAAFALGRLGDPFWRIYDISLLGLSLLHGANGLRIVVEDYIPNKGWRMATKLTLYTVVAFFMLLGTYVLLTVNAAPMAKGA